MKKRFCLCVLVFAFAACSGPAGECGDGVDNDGDGTTDGADSMCAYGSSESPAPDAKACLDGKDNDDDGFIDLEDPGCDDPDDDNEYQPDIAQCNDGIDNDGDGLIDSPDDPGCTIAVDDDESDDCPDGPGCPECSDGIDNDDDGLIDFGEEDGCDRAGDNSEINLDYSICGTSLTPLPEEGFVFGRVQASDGASLTGACGGDGSEVAFALVIDQPVALRVSTAFPETWLDTVIYLRSECTSADSELACNDDDTTGFGASLLEVSRVEPGTYYLVVDSHGGAFGEFALEVEMMAPLGGSCSNVGDCLDGLYCNDEVCAVARCGDGLDNDADGLIDDFDPGCISSDDNEEDPDPDPIPQCADGIDNDENGTIDYPDDENCSRASDSVEHVCAIEEGFLALDAPVLTGSTVSATSDINGACGGSGSNDVSYRLVIPGQLDTLTMDTNGSSFDTVLRIQEGECTAPEITCDDDGGEGVQSLLTMTDLAAGTYFIVVDAYSGSGGDYTLNVSGTIAAGEACDEAQITAGILACADTTSCTDGTCQ